MQAFGTTRLRHALVGSLAILTLTPFVANGSAAASSAKSEPHAPVHIHYSGWYPSSRAEVEADMDTFMAESDLITMTEVGGSNGALDEDGWQKVWFPEKTGPHARAGRGGNALTFKTDVYKLVADEAFLTTKKFYFSTEGDRQYVWATAAVLEDITSGRRIVVSVSHMPPRVEGRDGFYRGTRNREEVYRAALPGWRQQVDALANRYGASVKIATGDWNLDVKTKWVRKFLNSEWGKSNMEIVWKGDYPNGGTHEGGRIIDFTIASKVKAKPEIIGDVKSSDHNPFIETLNAR